MNLSRLTISCFAFLLVVGGTVGAVSASTSGFAVYNLQTTHNGVSTSFSVNETVASTSSPKIDTLILRVLSSTWNLNYSRSVNSTDQLFPYVPALPSQSFNFSQGSTQMSVRVSQNGAESLEFQGANYTLTSSSFFAQVSSSKLAGSVAGTLSTFPSGLLYSLKAQINGTDTVEVVLTSTSLALNAGASSSASQMASVGLGAGAAVSVLALSLGIRSRRRHNDAPANKPDYWVD